MIGNTSFTRRKQLAIESDSNEISGFESLDIYIAGFELIAKYSLGAGIIVILCAPLLKRLMGEVH